MTITDKLEGLLPADGNYTKHERVIADAVEGIRALEWTVGRQDRALADMTAARGRLLWAIYAAPLAFATGCIATAIFLGWV